MFKVNNIFNRKKTSLKKPDLLKSTQQSLQPSLLKEEDKSYQSVKDIAYRLQEGDATNIALTGPYGSGKSSILLTLRKNFPQYEYLNISLATLNTDNEYQPKKQEDTKEDKEEQKHSNNLNRLIEYSILQQLVYRESQSTLPNSRLKRIYHIEDKEIKKTAVSFILAIFSYIIIFEPLWLRVKWIYKLLEHNWLNIVADIICIPYLTFFAYKVLRKIIQSYSNSKLNKLNLKDGEIEIVENTSIFNKHLDEILYFFQMTKYDVVILEDLDRFNTTEIFLKLRELNLLLNESKIINRKVFFIYAVRDDMFKDAERSKCFDYITTVIPIINRSNAKNQLKQELKGRGVTELNDNIMKEMGFFISDMRLLKNIANEYVQYRNKLESGIKAENLLAMIVYKNYYPRDFAELHECKGMVYSLINMKETFFKKRIQDIETAFTNYESKREQYEQNRHLSEKELRIIYLDVYRKHLPKEMISIIVENKPCTFEEIANSEVYFDKLTSQDTITYSYRDYYNRTQQKSVNIKFQAVEKEVNEHTSYKERLALLRERFKSLEENKEEANIQKEDIRSKTIQQLMEDGTFKEMPEYQKLNIPPMIEYFVQKGYIDENYYDYISYFYGNMITQHDWNFILDLKLKKSHEYNYPIDHIESCIGEIPNQIFRTEAILNYTILDYLAEKSTADKLSFTKMLVLLKFVVSKKDIDFLSGYYEVGYHNDIVFPTLFDKHKNLWATFCKDDKNMSIAWIKYSELNQSCKESNEWISTNYKFIIDNIKDISEEKITTLIATYKYEFEKINDRNSSLLNTILEKNAYKLNKENVLILVNHILQRNNPEDPSLSYTLIKSTNNSDLIERIDTNLSDAMNNIFTEPAAKKESKNVILDILADNTLHDDLKIKYLSGQEEKFDLNELSPEVNTLAIQSNIVDPSWTNVLAYMASCKDTVTEELKLFVENNVNAIVRDKIPSDKEDARKLLRAFISSNVLSFAVFKKVLALFKTWTYSSFSTDNYEEDRIRELISYGMLEYTEKNANFIQNHYSIDSLVAYLENKKEDFLKSPEYVSMNGDLAAKLLKSAVFIDHEKANIVTLLQDTDINESLAELIVSLLTKIKINLDPKVLQTSLMYSKNTPNKITVIYYTLGNQGLDNSFVNQLLKTLPAPYSDLTNLGKKPLIPYGNNNEQLIDILKKIGFISSFSKEKKGIRVHTKKKI